jgi:hypothetical protein
MRARCDDAGPVDPSGARDPKLVAEEFLGVQQIIDDVGMAYVDVLDTFGKVQIARWCDCTPRTGTRTVRNIGC